MTSQWLYIWRLLGQTHVAYKIIWERRSPQKGALLRGIWAWLSLHDRLVRHSPWQNAPILHSAQRQTRLQSGPLPKLLYINWMVRMETITLFSPLSKLAYRAIYFTFRNLLYFLNEQSYLRIYWTDFRNFSFTKWKVIVWMLSIQTNFSDTSSDVAMATNFRQNWWNDLHSAPKHRPPPKQT